MRKNGFTVLELLIVIAILSLLAAIAIPSIAKKAHLKTETQTYYAHQVNHANYKPEGGDGMFRFIELLVILAILYIIANLIHYIFVRITGAGNEGFWLFGLSSGWLKKDEAKKQEQEEKTRTSNPSRRRYE